MGWMLRVVMLGAMGLTLCVGGASAQSSSATVVAKVGTITFTQKDVEDVIAGMTAEQRAALTEDGLRQVLDNMINRALILQDAHSRKIDTVTAVRAAIQQQADQVLVTAALQFLGQSLPAITDSAERAYYAANPKEFEVPKRVRVAQIQVDDEKKANEIKGKLDKGAVFEELAGTESKGDGAQNGGALGYIVEGQVIPDFEKAAFAAKPNTIVGPIKTALGWHILKVGDTQPAKTLTYDDVKDELKRRMGQAALEKATKALTDELRKKVDLEVKNSVLSSIVESVKKAPAPPAPKK